MGSFDLYNNILILKENLDRPKINVFGAGTFDIKFKGFSFTILMLETAKVSL